MVKELLALLANSEWYPNTEINSRVDAINKHNATIRYLSSKIKLMEEKEEKIYATGAVVDEEQGLLRIYLSDGTERYMSLSSMHYIRKSEKFANKLPNTFRS